MHEELEETGRQLLAAEEELHATLEKPPAEPWAYIPVIGRTLSRIRRARAANQQALAIVQEANRRNRP